MKTEKRFDAVQTMRRIRDSISAEISGMSYDEERRFIDERLKESRPPDEEQQRAKKG